MVFGGILNESIYESIRVIRSFTLTNIARNFPTNRCDPCTILTGRRSLPLWSTTLQYVDEIALTVDVKGNKKPLRTDYSGGYHLISPRWSNTLPRFAHRRPIGSMQASRP
ncbi:hypothetical protein RF11_03672 [Thelohanellus kitauei]|uniref:Uncharacterized protein n=1 Tax=Thelohanellus kitauei TaxID=669202 RepID=A0A0C2MUU4_THEKT|nr:hypothetical protein RF11_03672 [Thelohanellus kitauei]